jgi:hypothetical protein
MFVGVLTNAVFAMLLLAGRDASPRAAVEDLVFFGMNIGLLGFAVSLLAEQTWLERISTPVLGAAILLGLYEHTMRLRGGARIDPPEAVVAAALT